VKALSNGNGSTSTKLATIGKIDIRASQAIAESYRMLRTSVLLATAGRPPRTILVTSSQPSEGKTTTTVNTAICLAQLGARVLVIDADMRRPRIHRTFHIKSRYGLSTYLSNEVDPKVLIQPTSIPNLFVMPSGIIPPSAGDLLASDKMPKLLGILATQFDHIIIDSPPVINVADPVILARHCDGVIIVIRSNRCSRDVARHARTELANAGAKILGVVLNNVDVQDLGYDYYYQRYYGSYAGSSASADASRDSGRLNGVHEA
jgi:capsular exopolysaccharide synthesis family protein